jgi:transposase
MHYTGMIENAKSQTLLGIIRDHIQPDSIVYTDSFRSSDVLDVSEINNNRMNHSEKFADEKNHIIGIENFWNQAKRHMRRYNAIPEAHFYLFLKECEWRFNHRPASNLLKTISEWVKI